MSEQGTGREAGRRGGGWGSGSGLRVNARLLPPKTHPRPGAPLLCTCHCSPSICPPSAWGSIKRRQSGQVPGARQNKRKPDSVALIDDGSSPELGADKRPAKYELTAANLTGNRLFGCLSGHPSLSRNDWVMTSCVSVSTLGFAIEQLVSRFKCRPHKSFFEQPAQTQRTPVSATSVDGAARRRNKPADSSFVVLYCYLMPITERHARPDACAGVASCPPDVRAERLPLCRDVSPTFMNTCTQPRAAADLSL